ncbi:transporter [Plakobranchus ocellatus]|uniref:Transporter n=1 Tax=Plakobranchus ocellatus TaxID=259542 RepID=A0AAV4DJE5_9GAST|nr:transporter [Plakobranchus ocellatus]
MEGDRGEKIHRKREEADRFGLDHSKVISGFQALWYALSDEFPVLRRHREIFVACLFSLYFLVGLAFVSEGGFYLIRLMENFGAGYSILFAVLFETLAVSWCYGVDKFSADIEAMIGAKPGRYWHICWKFVAPIFIMFIIAFGLANYSPMEHDGYTYPMYANIIGWAIALSSILCIPGFAIFSIIRAKGSLSDRIYHLIQPTNNREEKIRRAMNTVRINGDVSGAVGV